jgi:hypothetical protein
MISNGTSQIIYLNDKFLLPYFPTVFRDGLLRKEIGRKKTFSFDFIKKAAIC